MRGDNLAAPETGPQRRRDVSLPGLAAHVVNARTFEILRAAGVDMAAIAAASADPADAGHVYWMTTLAGQELGRLPFERQGQDLFDVTPTPLRNLRSAHRTRPHTAAGRQTGEAGRPRATRIGDLDPDQALRVDGVVTARADRINP